MLEFYILHSHLSVKNKNCHLLYFSFLVKNNKIAFDKKKQKLHL